MSDKKIIFISLKWKILIIFGSLLIFSHCAQYIVSYTQLTQQFENQRKQEQQHQITLIHELIEQSSRLMEQAAETVPLLTISKSLSNTSEAVKISQYWNNQQANWGLSATFHFNAKQQLTDHWGESLKSLVSSKKVGMAFQSEQPITALACSTQCFQLVYTPTLTGVSVLVRSFADIIFAFDEITGNDIAILKPTLETTGDSKWKLQLTASSNPTEIGQIYDVLLHNFNSSNLYEEEVIISIGSKKIATKLFQFPTEQEGHTPVLLFATDLTDKIHKIEQIKSDSLQVILITLLLSTLLTLAISIKYTRRIISVSSALPALSKGAFESVRQSLGKIPPYFFLPHKDEINSLIESTLSVSKQLESSQKQIDINTNLLKTQNKKIAKDHQYLTGLLDTAPVIILSQTTDGTISSINRLGCELLSSTPDQLINKKFDDFFSPSNSNDSYQTLARFRENPEGIIELETTSDNISNGTTRTISWIHKDIQDQSDSLTILSLGQDITERKIAEDDLIWLVDHDPLTNLSNRRYFQQMFEQQLSISERYQETGAVLFFDLDQFKYINDTSGHKAGDELLVIISNTLKKLVRTSDTLARLGGDEFAILIPETNALGATQLAIKILDKLKSIEFNPAGYTHNISASIGIVLFPEASLNVQDLMANADIAMYHAKESGRGCWHVFTLEEQAREKLTERVLWKEKIESAIQDDRFIFHYQPILDIKSNKISHAEALIRMIGPAGEIIMPDNFISIAEQTGLINQIDILVLKLAFTKLSTLYTENSPLTLSINLSGKAFNNPSLLSFLKKELERPDINAEKLIIEVTETTAIENFTAAKKMISEISAIGVRFALDDFGVGFSSFQHLRHLDVAYIKIDGSFIRQIGKLKEDQILVQAIADIAKASGKKTIAEFVENEEILNKVKAFGIDYAQGYHIAKPSSEIELDQ